MTTPAHSDPNSGLLKSEPVVIAHIVLWLITNAGVLLVSRYHVATDAQWKVASVELTPLLTALLLGVSAWLIRRVVTPAWKLAQTDLAKLGITLPSFGGVSPAQAADLRATAVTSSLPEPLTADQLTAAPTGADTDPPAGTDLTDPATAPTTDTTGATA